ncbi:MAG TPA: class I SAM-dependent methyltransferase [Steroidobacteraceae bacterium]|nr:class I SAM-dependent methyltransferase [Steroidobacteraceae bacterium]
MHESIDQIREPAPRFRYHQFRARLGMGDLHPGGAPATQRLLGCLSERGVRRVLEAGAGIGNTAARMLARGWEVVALEPDPVLFGKLAHRVGPAARREGFFEHESTAPYDAIVAESVFFQLPLARVFEQARHLLRPGGYLGFVEAVWTAKISPESSRELHERTQRLFGIAVGSRDPLTWQNWMAAAAAAGFSTLHAQRLPRGSSGHPPTPNRTASLLAMVRDPRLALWMARYRLRKRKALMPPGCQESWLYLGQAPGA